MNIFLRKSLFLFIIMVINVMLITSSLIFREKIRTLIHFMELKYVQLMEKEDKFLKSDLKMPDFIAHAGGEINGLTYTNSLDALNLNYKRGYRFFEIDINWTSDNHLVLIHDWDVSVIQLFGLPPKIYTLQEFSKAKSLYGLKQMTFADLNHWLTKHNDAYIVTDCKKNNVDALAFISSNYPENINRIIPQIYSFAEYNKVKAMGFRAVILTLYVRNYSDDVLLDFLKTHPVDAVTMPLTRAISRLPSKLQNLGIFTYAHTINEIELINVLKANGVNGIYTDCLFLSIWPVNIILSRPSVLIYQGQ